jgi:hypothetical protein
MIGTIDSGTSSEKGIVYIGNQMSGKQKLFYVSE